MTQNEFIGLAWALAIVVIPIMLITWNKQKKQIGTIRCKRCNHVGPSKGLFVPFRGMKPVCEKCQSDDWTTVQEE